MNEIDVVRAHLADWTGANAILWDYTVSHRRLVIRLHRPDRPKRNLHVICGACEWIGAPTKWSDSNLRFANAIAGEGGRLQITLEDARVGARIVCGAVVAEANVEPIY